MRPRAATPFGRAMAEIDADARDSDVPVLLARAVLWLPAVGTLALMATFAHRPLFRAVLTEDGVLEWLQVVAICGAAVGGGVAARRYARRSVPTAVLFAGFVLIMLAGVGEEISWGQRIFGWSTPEGLEEINHQGETNLHNITTDVDAQLIFNLMQLAAGLAGSVLPWLTRTSSPLLRSSVLWAVSPPLFTSTGFALLAAYRVIRFFVPSTVTAAVKMGEWAELCFAISLCFLGFAAARAAGRAAVAPLDVPRTDPAAR